MKGLDLGRYALCSCVAKIFNFGRYVLAFSAAAMLLAACGALRQPQDDLQPTIGTPGLAPQVSRASSSSYNVLYRFSNRIVSAPSSALLDLNGTLYGTTYGIGRRGNHLDGAVYSLSTTGVAERFYAFHGPDGAYPQGGLLNVKGTLYGTTEYGGASGLGVVYSLTTTGVQTVLYSFKGGSDGAHPYAGLIDVGGTLYGTTHDGGSAGCACGTVYSVSTAGAETVLHSFGGGADGEYPFASLVEMKGTLYGTTFGAVYFGKPGNNGTVYKISTSGSEQVLHRFTGRSDGANPVAPLIAVKGTLYGTTASGGKYCNSCGVVFSMSATGKERALYNFRAGHDGDTPAAPLVDVNGTLYGTTSTGGGSGCPYIGCGILYSVSASGSENVVHRFQGGSDGAYPHGGLINVGGTLYGTTSAGGGSPKCPSGCGTVFTEAQAGPSRN